MIGIVSSKVVALTYGQWTIDRDRIFKSACFYIGIMSPKVLFLHIDNGRIIKIVSPKVLARKKDDPFT